MKQIGDQFLAGSGLPFDQGRVWRVRVLVDLVLQFLKRRAVPNERIRVGCATPRYFCRAELQCAQKNLFQTLRVAGFRDKFGCPQGSGMTRIRGVVLTGQHQNLHGRRMREQITYQGEPFVGTMRRRRKSQVDEGELGGIVPLSQQADGMATRIADEDIKIPAQRERKGLGDERVVVN